MGRSNKAPDLVAAQRRQNLKVLNPHRPRPALAPSLAATERQHGLRFIVQTGERSSSGHLEAMIWQRHGLAATVQPLFADLDPAADANGMDRFSLVTLPGLARRDIAGNVFDIAHALANDTPDAAFVSVEPDIPHSVYQGWPDVAIAGDVNPCSVATAAPVDRAWHLRAMRVPAAWARTPAGRRFGQGSVIGHIDTGWADHDDFFPANVDLERGWDFVGDDPIPRDPLERGSFLGGPASPGHGTATSSVIVGRGDGGATLPDPAAREMWGVAPRATLVPIRAIRFVFFLLDGDVARAIRFAADQGCHVISMSLGGVPTPALEAAVNYAVARNVIVCAAAGNCLPSVVVGPAIYPNCIAVAGCGSGDAPWPFSSHGAAVAVTAPAENVWTARRRPGDPSTGVRTAGQGTSFAVAGVAGIAALWLAHHGREALLSRYRGQAFLHHVFRRLLQETARPSGLLPAGDYGSGIADADALLAAPLPSATEVAGPASVADLTILTQAEVIAAMYGAADRTAVQSQLARLLGPTAALAAGTATPDPRTALWGAELIHLLAQDPAVYQQFGAALATTAGGISPVAVASGANGDGIAAAIGRIASRSLGAALR
jgi:hypothetical protein